MSKVIGCDVGGTFTDLILLDEALGEVSIAKVPTTPNNQAVGVMAAMAQAGADCAELSLLLHGTTTTTNALLEKKIARCGLITTAGFRDVLELGRRTRPNPYGLIGSFEPLISREYRLEVPERMDADGKVVTALDEGAVRRAAAELVEMGCESLVIHFLHAYANSSHEVRAAEIAAEVWPNSHITRGSAILAEFREYERGVAAAVNAAIQPVLARYLERLRQELSGAGYARDLLVMQGNGGTISSAMVAEQAVNTVMSGPASGVMAAAYTGGRCGFENIISYDMGGTSSDVGLIQGGIPATSSELQLEYGMPIHVPMVDVHSIGAGGGSIAFINDAGMLQVGPRSSGAEPGPICYGRGGVEPTITDANLVLGRLNPDALLAVDNPVSLEQLRRRLLDVIGEPLDLDAEGAAAAILQIGNDRMAGAIRMVSLARGHDPRDFALFAFGGAGPLHATALAAELAIPQVLIPAKPGITNAIGCAVADVRHDYVNTVNQPLADVDMDLVHSIMAEQIAQGRAIIQAEGVEVEELVLVHAAEMQFQGQSHMLRIPLESSEIGRADIQAAFDEAYFNRFALHLPEIGAVLVTLHTAVIGRRREVALASLMEPGLRAEDLAAAEHGQRKVWFPGGWQDTPIISRDALPIGACFMGPAVLEQLDTTIIIEPSNEVEVDQAGNLVIHVAAAFRE
ncbi:MAG: hydantoinase/oxoprolinase family protein [Alphaproteobacteria bacterium]|nr:hydantoinase/oxoprolinase family protein [Alphaproteobacteria bacterium]MDP6256895.1 hydantoinase/oxoprolinase family protein [Alphaproteobacteria bacterium]MDP7053914.1 hydantoinase/oxoprolinase family protein [Alphaproteobacteria bacterium]MDP7228252.1 hydantoinase/oxoprolinase family protein [Alphaproteobacteria bacterium]MDP7460474.1 hydantoinase/oxoprolinase family protein [Alphaproteobacteria bacterium]